MQDKKTQKAFFPSISYLNELLSSPRIKPYMERLHPASVLATARGVIDDISGEVFSAATEWRMPDFYELVEKIVTRLQIASEKGGGVLLDGTGVLLSNHQQPIASLAMEEMVRALDAIEEINDATICALICRLTGAEDALVFSSPDVARLSLFSCFGRSTAIVLARRDLFEDTRGNRLETVLRLSDSKYREVGAANRVQRQDYVREIERQCGLVYMAMGEFSELTPPLGNRELSLLSEQTLELSIPIVLDAMIAPLLNLSAFFSTPIPSVSDYLKGGYELVLFSSDQLIGGPRCGIIAGKKGYISQIRREQKFAEVFPIHRVDRAGLHKTLMLSQDDDVAFAKIPILQMVTASEANLHHRATHLIPQLAWSPYVQEIEERQGVTSLCGVENGNMENKACLPTSLLAILPKGKNVDEFCRELATIRPSVRGKKEDTRLLLDLRTIPPMYDPLLVEIFERLGPLALAATSTE